jgi:DNA repair exonuclease SbcCD ATPase subunit
MVARTTKKFKWKGKNTMKSLKLIELNITNFKGIKQFSLVANGNDLVVKGRNATGKTTLFDAFTWLLFGRDSANRTQFEIKTLDEEGNVKQHGVNHEVEAKFEIDKRQIAFKRVYKEEWTKHRGSAKKTFTGHTTDYFIDDVPFKKKDYDAEVGKIVSDETFKILTNPTYFNEQLDRKQRRQVLLDMIEDISDQDVAEHSKNKELIGLVERLQGKNIEQHQKGIKNKQRDINKELDRIPIRIDEIELSLPDTTGLNEKKLQSEIESIDKDIEEKQTIISNIRNGGQVSEYQKQLSDIDMELTKIRNNHDSQTNEELYQLKASLQEKESNVTILSSKKDNENQMIQYNEEQIGKLNEQVERLRKDWTEADAEKFEHNEECSCPTCGQELPEEQIEEAREKAESQFNERKANKLERIVEDGKSTKERIDSIQSDIEKANKTIEKYEKEIESNQAEVEKLKKSIESLENNKTDITENKEYIEKLQEKERIERQIAEIRASTQDSIDSIREEIEKLESEKKEIQDDLNKFDIAKRSEARLKELEEQEKTLTTEYEQLEKELFLTEEFTRSKVSLLEERINSKFKYATFKLFEEQVDGGLKETCETLYEGVPYSRGLNNAARINVGLDIINTLNERYGIQVPIFIDNRESVTDLIEIESQTISLVVEPKAYQLEVQDPQEVAI